MKKGGYVDGFVFVVPKKNTAAYIQMAKEGATAWKKFGALQYMECKGDDLKAKKDNPQGPVFPKITNAKPSDAVWFSIIVFKNKKHRDEVNKKVMAYFAKKYSGQDFSAMPFDVKKMSYGGFSVEVSA